MKLIIGLGNSDKKYQNTRHNTGCRFIESLKKSISTKNTSEKIITGINDGYMNEAGQSVQKIVHFYKTNLDEFYLAHDDLDLPVGEWRIQFDRGPAGHHGVESVVQHIGSQAFNRIRIGIGHPPEHIPVEDFVLKPFTESEEVLINNTIDRIVEEIMGH